MAASTQGSGGGGAGKVPPRPGGGPSVPGRPPGGRSSQGGSGRPGGRPAPRASARQLAQRRRQRNIYTAGGAAGAVIVVVVVLIAVSLTGGGATKSGVVGKSKAADGTFALTGAILNQVEGVPVSTLVAQAAKEPKNTTPPQALPAGDKALTLGGKPEILYIGALYCPFCAAERWAMLMALSKFGTFSGVEGTTSSATDVNPSTPTFSFYGSSYTSKYLSFVPVELETNTYAKLQTPTAGQDALITKWDAPPYVTQSNAGSIPFVYMAGKYLQIGAQYDASPISGMQFQEAASYMTGGTNATSKGVEAAAGYLVGDLCALTHDHPASVCSQVPAKLIGIATSSPASSSGSKTTGTTKASG